MSWAVGVSLCLLLPSFNDFSAARSLCDFPVFAHFLLVSAESWEHGPIQLLMWCAPAGIPLAAVKNSVFLQVPSFLYFILLLVFFFFFSLLFSFRLWPSRFVVASLFSVLAALGRGTWNCQLLGSRRVALATHPPASRESPSVLFLLLLSRLTNTYTQIHVNTQT